MPRAKAPTAGRRTVLKLLAGSIAGAGLSGCGAGVAGAAPPPTVAGDAAMSLEFDASLRSRVVAQLRGVLEPLTDFDASEALLLADGRRIDDFAFLDQRSEGVDGTHGRGTRHVLRGRAAEGIEKEVSIVFHDRYPGFALTRVGYRNAGEATVSIAAWLNSAHVLKPATGSAPEYWSFSGASYEDRRDWVQPVKAGFEQ